MTKTKIIIIAIFLLFCSLNVISVFHAYHMSYFVTDGTRTKNPEQLAFFEKLSILLTGVKIPKPVNKRYPSNFGLNFTNHRIQTNSGIFLDSWLIEGKDKENLIILFHGYAASMESNLERSFLLNEHGFSTLLIDFRGSGNSSENYTTMGFYEADDIHSVLEFVNAKFKYKNIIFFGRSMGAAAIFTYLAKYGYQPKAVIVESLFDNLLNTTSNRFYLMNLPAFPFAHLLIFWGSLIHGYNGFNFNPADYALKIKSNTLLLYGKHDGRITLDETNEIYKNLAGKKKLHVFQKAGHNINLSKNKIEWQNEVIGFINHELQ